MNINFPFSADDLDGILGNVSYSSSNTDSDDDVSGWMRSIDVSTFQRLASSSDLDAHLTPENIIPSFNDAFNTSILENLKEEEVVTSTSPPPKRTRLSSNSSIQRRRKQNMTKLCASDDEEISLLSLPDLDDASIPDDSSISDQSVSNVKPRFPKPVYSYSSLIALALKNSPHGHLQVADIYAFICKTFPFFRTAASGWKNSVRHNLSLNKCFEKIEMSESTPQGRKFCSWAVSADKVAKLEAEICRSREKNPIAARAGYANPDDMEKIESGLKTMQVAVGKQCFNGPRKRGRPRGRPLNLTFGRTRPLMPVFVPSVSGKRTAVPAPRIIAKRGGHNFRGSVRPVSRSNVAVQRRSSSDDDSDSDSDSDSDEESTDSCPSRESSPMPAVTDSPSRRNDSPPPNSFSTPIRSSLFQTQPRWSPAFSVNENHRRQLWPLQNNRTPEKTSHFSFLPRDESPSGKSSVYGTPEKMERFGKLSCSRFATSFEFAFRATSPLNNSLILQTNDFYGQVDSDGQGTSFAEMN